MKEAKLANDVVVKATKPRLSSVGGLAAIRMWPSRTKSFLEDVRLESKRVTWPSFMQIRATTVVVILTVFFFGVYFGILDWFFNIVIRRILRLGG